MKTKTKIIMASSVGVLTLGLLGFTNSLTSESKRETLDLDNKYSTSLPIEEKNTKHQKKNEIVTPPDLTKKSTSFDVKPTSKGKLNTYFKKHSVDNVLKNVNAVKNPKLTLDVDKVLEKKWDVDIGNMSYRSNYELVGNYLYVGSNGDHFRDWRHVDKKSGVYKINTKNGKVSSKFCDANLGDMDVNGLLYHNGNLFFGNDNDEFISTDLNGKINWRIPVSGDVEHKPTLIKNKENNFIVFATETGEVRAVNPQTGNTVWQHRDRAFSGWKEGDNRYVFKLQAHFTDGELFFHEPGIGDFNRDGVMDVLYGGTDIKAINGANGKVLWKIPAEFNDVANKVKYEVNMTKATPLVVGKGKNTKVLTYAKEMTNIDSEENESKNNKGKILVFNYKGKLINRIPYSFEFNKGSWRKTHVENYKINDVEAAFVSNNTIYIYNAENNAVSIIKQFNKFYKDHWGYIDEEYYGKVEIAPFKIKTNVGACRLVKWEFGPNTSKDERNRQSIVKLFKVDDNSEVLTLRLPSGEEGPLLIKDIDRDGKKELLVECNGKLICYDLTSLKI